MKWWQILMWPALYLAAGSAACAALAFTGSPYLALTAFVVGALCAPTEMKFS
jgi:hypothetical protein